MEMPASKSSSQDYGTDHDVRQTGAVARPRSGIAMGQRRSDRVTARRQSGRRSGESEMEEDEEGDIIPGSHRGTTVDRGHGGARGGPRGGFSTTRRGTSLPMATDEVEVWDPGGQRRGVAARRRGGRLLRGRRRATQTRERGRSRGNYDSPSRHPTRSEASVDRGDVPSNSEETEAEETHGGSASETEEEHGEEEGVTEAPRPERTDTRAIREAGEEEQPQSAREKSRIKRSEISERQPSRPSRPKSAFICFLTEFRNRYAESQPKGSRRPRVADVSKAAGEAWKHLTPQEREKYEVISDKSKETYRAERDRLRPPKRIRLEGQPPRPRGAYFHFLSDFRRQYYERNPQEERKPMKVISQLASEEWKRLPEDTKKPYIIEARRDKERYRTWRAKQLERERSPPSTVSDEEERTEASEEIAESGGGALRTRSRSPRAETTLLHADVVSEIGRGSRRREGIEHWEEQRSEEARWHLSEGILQRRKIPAGGIDRTAVMAQPMKTMEERFDASNVLESFLISDREVTHVPEDVRKALPSDREHGPHGLPQRLEQGLDVTRSGIPRQQGLPPLPPSASRSRLFASQPPTTMPQPSMLVSVAATAVGLPSWHVARDELMAAPLGRVSQSEMYGGQTAEVFLGQQQQFERRFVSSMEASASLSRFATGAPAGIVTPSTGVVSLTGAASQVPQTTALGVSPAVASMNVYPSLHQMPVYIHTHHWPWQAGGPMPPGSYPQQPPAQTQELTREDSMSARLHRELKAQLESLQSLLHVSNSTPDQPHPVPPAMVDSEAAGALLALAGNTPSFQGSIQVSPPRTILPIAMVSEARAREIFPGFEGGEAASFQQAIESTNLNQAGQSALDMAKRQLKAVQELQEVLSAQVNALQKLTTPVERILPSIVTSAGPSDLQAPALAGRLLQRPEESEAAREIRSMALPSGAQERISIAYDQFAREQQLERRSVEQDVSQRILSGGGQAAAPLVLDSYPISRAIISSGTDFTSLDIRNVPTGELPGTSRGLHGQTQVMGPSTEPLPPPTQTQQQQIHPSSIERQAMQPIGVPLESQQLSSLFQSEAFQQSQILIPVIFPSLRGVEETSVYLPIVSGAEAAQLIQQRPLVYQVEETHVVHDAAPAESQATTRPSGDAGGHTHSSGHGGPQRASTSVEPFEGQSQRE